MTDVPASVTVITAEEIGGILNVSDSLLVVELQHVRQRQQLPQQVSAVVRLPQVHVQHPQALAGARCRQQASRLASFSKTASGQLSRN